MPRKTKPLVSKMARSTPESIRVRGFDLPSELMGHVSFGDMVFIEITGRKPDPDQSIVFNAMLVTLVEHGMTPNAIAARLTWLGAPEALQGAVAAGLLGLGTRFAGTMEGAASMLAASLREAGEPMDLQAVAAGVVAAFSVRGALVPGLGHPLHKPEDPRTVRLFELAQEHHLAGRYVELMKAIRTEAERVSGKTLPINATGAIAALLCELGFDARMARGIAVISRAVGLVGHLWEEMETPLANEVYLRVEEEVSKDTDF